MLACLGLAQCRAAELVREVHGVDAVEWQGRLQAEMAAVRHDAAAAELVVEVDTTAVWTVCGARRAAA